jgi:thiamine-monophosphate kinase
LSLRDDAAYVIPPDGSDLVLTTDAIVAGTHFFPTDPADAVGRKALRVNLSDLAAKGATPAGFLLTVGLPAARGDWLKRFSAGLGADARAFACPLLGGDTVRTDGPVFVAITAFGTVPHGAMVERRGARPGDYIVVTGSIGDAALGLALRRGSLAAGKLTAAQRTFLLQRYLLPQPRNALAAGLRRHARAAIDVSDGLVGDVGKLCLASGVGAELSAPSVPLSAAARAAVGASPELLTNLLTGGDDFEIACAVAPEQLSALLKAARRAGIPLTLIGRVVPGRGVRVIGGDGRRLHFRRSSFSHF